MGMLYLTIPNVYIKIHIIGIPKLKKINNASEIDKLTTEYLSSFIIDWNNNNTPTAVVPIHNIEIIILRNKETGFTLDKLL